MPSSGRDTEYYAREPGSLTTGLSALYIIKIYGTHHKLGSFSSNGYVPKKYSKKSGEMSRSSAKFQTYVNLDLELYRTE